MIEKQHPCCIHCNSWWNESSICALFTCWECLTHCYSTALCSSVRVHCAHLGKAFCIFTSSYRMVCKEKNYVNVIFWGSLFYVWLLVPHHSFSTLMQPPRPVGALLRLLQLCVALYLAFLKLPPHQCMFVFHIHDTISTCLTRLLMNTYWCHLAHDRKWRMTYCSWNMNITIVSI